MGAMSVIVILALVGGGVDMSRAYRVQNRLQNACDAGALAGRRAVSTNGFDATAQTQAFKYFDVNYDQVIQSTSATSRSFIADTRANTISGTASTKMDLLIMRIFGMGAMTINANCTSTMGVGNSDVMMVLDVTGSMGTALGTGTRISALKSAMKNFYSTMATATNGTNARVRYGFVPFSSTVNVGRLLKNEDSSYLADNVTLQSRVAKFDTATTVRFHDWTGSVNSRVTSYANTPNSTPALYGASSYGSIYDCNAALPNDTVWFNNGGSSVSSGSSSPIKNGAGNYVTATITTQPVVMTSYMCLRSSGAYYPYSYRSFGTQYNYSYANSGSIDSTTTTTTFDHFDYRPVTFSTNSFKMFNSVTTPTNSNGANESSVWDGCIEERNTQTVSSFSYSTINGMSPGLALDLDIDTAPTGDQATKWAPLWTQLAYTRSSNQLSTTGYGTTEYCVTQAQGFQTMSQSAYNSYADSLSPLGGTYLDIGMIWGGRLSSPEGIFGTTVNEEPSNGGNVSRHLIFMTDGDMDTSNAIYQSYGIEAYDRRITSDGSKTQDDARHSLRFRAICDAIKAKGIRIWVIAFTNSLNADLNYCTSPSSSYVAADAAQLNAAFQDIAKQVGELRVLQ